MGAVAKWQGMGLQNPHRRFDSAPRLQILADESVCHPKCRELYGEERPASEGGPYTRKRQTEARKSRSLDCAARRAIMRRGRESRAAPPGMTSYGSRILRVCIEEAQIHPPNDAGGHGKRPFETFGGVATYLPIEDSA